MNELKELELQEEQAIEQFNKQYYETHKCLKLNKTQVKAKLIKKPKITKRCNKTDNYELIKEDKAWVESIYRDMVSIHADINDDYLQAIFTTYLHDVNLYLQNH